MTNAAKTEFTKEINSQLRDLDSLLILVNTDILDLNTNLRRDARARRQLIHDWIDSKLAGKDWATISDLREVFPNIVGGELIKKAYDEEKQRIDKLRRELHDFDPNTYEHIIEGTRLGLEREEGQKKNWEDIRESRFIIEGYQDLIEKGYGTSKYSINPFSNPIRYCKDWRLADKVMDRLRCKTWDEVLENHRETEKFIQACEKNIARWKAEIEKWHSKKKAYAHLKLEEDRIERTVLEKIEISLKAAIDTIPGNSKKIIADLEEIESRIRAAEAQIISSQKERSFLSTRIEGLTKIKNIAEKSKKTNIPMDYVQKIRSSKPRERTDAQKQRVIEQPALDRTVFETYFYEAPAPSYSSRSSSYGNSYSSSQSSQHSNGRTQSTSYDNSSSYDSTYGRFS